MIETDIHKAISDLVGKKGYPLVAPQGTDPPYIIYSVISEHPSDTLKGYGANRINIQIDCYSKSLLEAKSLVETAINRLGFLLPGEVARHSGHEPETDLYRATTEFITIQ